MPCRVHLYFETFTHKELERKIKGYNIIRLKAAVKLKTPYGWSKIYDAIVDTGAHTSVIPQSVWEGIEKEIITKHSMQGLSIKPECAIPVMIGKAFCMLVDEGGNQTKEKDIHAYLAVTDDVPLIIGFKDLLSQLKLYCDYKNNKAWVEE